MIKSTLFKNLKGKRVILASASPRRKELLKGLDIPFTIQIKEVDEIYPIELEAGAITEFLAEMKAAAFTNLNTDTILITADTIVWLENKALLKPKDREDAIKIIGELSGKKHEVYTSVCMKSKNKTKVITDVTEVYFEELLQEEIAYYVDKYKPYDKAGGYGAQDWIGYMGIKKLIGSYFNVMGLPVHKVYKELMQF